MLFSSFTLNNLSRRHSYSPSCAKETPPQIICTNQIKILQTFKWKAFKLEIGNGLNGAFSQWIYMWGEKVNSNSRIMSWKRVKKGQAQFKVMAEYTGTDEKLDS